MSRPKSLTDFFAVKKNATQLMILSQMYGGQAPKALPLLAAAFLLTGIGVYIAFHFFADNAGVISVFFAVLGILPTLDILIERNKHVMRNVVEFDFSREKMRADVKLAFQFLLLFVSIFLAYGLVGLFIPPKQLITSFSGQLGPWIGATGPHYSLSAFGGILLNNLSVAAGVLLLTLVYRTGGALLVLVWNASVWGVVFAYFSRNQADSGFDAFIGFFSLIACIFPHILLEAVGYITMALAGIVLVRFFAHMSTDTPNIKRMGMNSLSLAVASAVIIFFGALVEVTLSPTLLELMKTHLDR
jgi:hypothetical protein